jgi:hypothetical protein
MGGNISKQLMDDSTKIVNESLMKVSTNIKESTSSSASSTQVMNVRFTGDLNCTNVSLKQVSSVILNVINNSKSEVSNELAAEITDKISEKLSQAAEQKNSGLNLGQVNSAELQTMMNTYIKNSMTSIIENNISKMFSQSSDGTQQINFDATNINCENLNIDQDMVIQQISENIVSDAVSNAIKHVASTDVAKEASQKTEQTNEGLTLFGGGFIIILVLAGIFLFGGSIMKYIIPIITLISLAVMIYFIYLKKTNLAVIAGIIFTILLGLFIFSVIKK